MKEAEQREKAGSPLQNSEKGLDVLKETATQFGSTVSQNSEKPQKPIAEQREKAGSPLQNSEEGLVVLKESAKAIGISHDTLARAKKVYAYSEQYPDIWKQLNRKD